MEAFYTIQGEGRYQGTAAYFIRLGGCDVGCHWCDVKESWDAEAHPQQSIEEIVEQASKYPSRVAVITGGEPLMHNLDALCEALHLQGFRTHLETSGAYPLTGHWDWVCLSPKKFKKPLAEVCQAADELKVVIYNKFDFEWAESYSQQVGKDCTLLLQPEWDRTELMLPLMISYIKQHPQWRMSLQMHKYINVP
ncbi:Organic radical activating enzyme [Flexibacter flexilis DSM 6793]|uniref:7-carboxy-7-deazaguanine synthase n=1 Tax=Flexibacter flexilis DSM 6793 TaxID=927664 RepID=A0A1I1HV95_9BACT|nr:Organic radical activating enzyme [Flexibacter flexilis DSM 6793]